MLRGRNQALKEANRELESKVSQLSTEKGLLEVKVSEI
jgi:hypothetical protein